MMVFFAWVKAGLPCYLPDSQFQLTVVTLKSKGALSTWSRAVDSFALLLGDGF